MSEIKFDFSPETLTVDTLIFIEDHGADRSVRTMRDLLAMLAMDVDGNALNLEQAKATIGKMTLAQLNLTMDELGTAIKGQETSASGEASGS